MRLAAPLTVCAVLAVGCAEREKPQETPAPPPAVTAAPLAAPSTQTVTPTKFSQIKDIRKVMPKVYADPALNGAAPAASADAAH